MSEDEKGIQQQDTMQLAFNPEEYSSLRNAAVVMSVISIIVTILYLLGLQPFLFEFELGVFFVPTVVILVSWLIVWERNRGRYKQIVRPL